VIGRRENPEATGGNHIKCWDWEGTSLSRDLPTQSVDVGNCNVNTIFITFKAWLAELLVTSFAALENIGIVSITAIAFSSVNDDSSPSLVRLVARIVSKKVGSFHICIHTFVVHNSDVAAGK
jgi:hypothetical protein